MSRAAFPTTPPEGPTMLRKFIAFLVMAFVATAASAQFSAVMLTNATSVGNGPVLSGIKAPYGKQYQVDGSVTSGTGSATVAVYCSVGGGVYDSTPVATVTVELTPDPTANANSALSFDSCTHRRPYVSAISGTGASVNMRIGY